MSWINKDGLYKAFCVTNACWKGREKCVKNCKKDGVCIWRCRNRWGNARPKKQNCTGTIDACNQLCLKKCPKPRYLPRAIQCTNDCSIWVTYAKGMEKFGYKPPY